jgi:hypothetical protein
VIRKKPPVRAIRGSDVGPDVITQKDLQSLAQLQDAEWYAGQVAHDAAREIQRRILHGATVQAGPLAFEPLRKMARTRKVG